MKLTNKNITKVNLKKFYAQKELDNPCSFYNKKFSGFPIYKDNKYFYVANKPCHTMLYNKDKTFENLMETIDKYIQSTILISTCSISKPTIFAINSAISTSNLKYFVARKKEYIVTFDNNYSEHVGSPIISLTSDKDDLDKVIEDIIIAQNNKEVQTPIIFIIDALEKTKIKRLDSYMSIAISRNIFFVLIVEDAELLDKTFHDQKETIMLNIGLKHNFEKGRISSIELNYLNEKDNVIIL